LLFEVSLYGLCGRLAGRFDDGGTYAFRVFADNRAAFSVPLESDWITPDTIGKTQRRTSVLFTDIPPDILYSRATGVSRILEWGRVKSGTSSKYQSY